MCSIVNIPLSCIVLLLDCVTGHHARIEALYVALWTYRLLNFVYYVFLAGYCLFIKIFYCSTVLYLCLSFLYE